MENTTSTASGAFYVPAIPPAEGERYLCSQHSYAAFNAGDTAPTTVVDADCCQQPGCLAVAPEPTADRLQYMLDVGMLTLTEVAAIIVERVTAATEAANRARFGS